MSLNTLNEKQLSAHVVVLGNEKGGSGKSTTALHIAVALMKAGQRVATIDLDGRQKSFTHYIENRRAWGERARVKLELPTHYCVTRGESSSLDANEAKEFAAFSAAIAAVEHSHDVVVIDTPGNDTYLMRLAHSMADTLVTPLNDSFLDFDVLGHIDATNFTVTRESHYSEMVREARRQRRLVDGCLTDWVVVRNRLATLTSRNKKLVGEGLTELSKRMGFRSVDGFAERVVYREFFPRGLTALDDLDETVLGTQPNLSHVTAREEVIALLNTLNLPLSETGKRRAAARAEWYSVMDQPLQVHDVIA
ncbi:MAG: division plane positioning ATPase MipZ [Hyphomicrobiales bacterium]